MHTYKGVTITECERVKGEHSGQWVIRSAHPKTSLLYSDQDSPHYHTLAAAKEAINESLKTERN